jgi:ABC-type transport system involved in cytochrome c biogenesis ATPase subunit
MRTLVPVTDLNALAGQSLVLADGTVLKPRLAWTSDAVTMTVRQMGKRTNLVFWNQLRRPKESEMREVIAALGLAGHRVVSMNDLVAQENTVSVMLMLSDD